MDTEPLRDLIEALELRRLVALSTTFGVVIVGLVLAFLFPSIVPPHPLVGAAVGLAALTIGAVAAVAADAGDEVVRGSRHVRATGAVVAAEGHGLLDDLVLWAEEHASDSPQFSLAIVGAGVGDASATRIAETIGTALARTGRRVLVADLATERADGPGLAEVGRGEEKLSKAVTFSTEVDLARVASGRPLTDALVALPRIAPRLQGDVEVLVAALPGLRQPATLLAATAAGRSLMLVTEGRTSRVDVIAGLQALDAARAPADLVVIPEDGISATTDASTSPVADDLPREDARDPLDEVPDLLPDPVEGLDDPAGGLAGSADDLDDPGGEPTDPADERGDAAEELVGSDDLGGAPFGDEDDWTEPFDPIGQDEHAEQDEPYEPAADDPELPFDLEDEPAGATNAPGGTHDPVPGPDLGPEPPADPRDEPPHDPPYEPPPAARDEVAASAARDEVAASPVASDRSPSKVPDLDLSGDVGEVRDELQRIASVIALERELVERDHEHDHDTDGVA